MATGGNSQLLGGIKIFINDKKININDTSWYRGMMFSGIPNLFLLTQGILILVGQPGVK